MSMTKYSYSAMDKAWNHRSFCEKQYKTDRKNFMIWIVDWKKERKKETNKHKSNTMLLSNKILVLDIRKFYAIVWLTENFLQNQNTFCQFYIASHRKISGFKPCP